MTRRQLRSGMYVFLFGFAGLLIYLGFQGWTFSHVVPTYYVGFFLVASAVSGFFGVNIWAGGPLDPRNDPPPKSDGEDRPPTSTD